MNKRVIISILITLILISTTIAQYNDYNPNKTYKVVLSYKDGDFDLVKIRVVNRLPDSLRKGDYTAKVISSTGQELAEQKFKIDSYFFADDVDETGHIIGGGMIPLEESNVFLHLPYFNSAETITIHDTEGNLKLSIDTDEADVCGNSICESTENHYICSQDCKSETSDQDKDGILDVYDYCISKPGPEVYDGCPDDNPPTLTLTTNPTELWPPNDKPVDVTITGSVTDDLSGIDESSLRLIVNNEEKEFIIDDYGNFNIVTSLIAKRSGQEKQGYEYKIELSAEDNFGNAATGSFTVSVPHDQRR